MIDPATWRVCGMNDITAILPHYPVTLDIQDLETGGNFVVSRETRTYEEIESAILAHRAGWAAKVAQIEGAQS